MGLWESEKEGMNVLVKKYLLLDDFEKDIKLKKKNHLFGLGPVSASISRCQNENQEHCCPPQCLLEGRSGVINPAALSLEPGRSLRSTSVSPLPGADESEFGSVFSGPLPNIRPSQLNTTTPVSLMCFHIWQKLVP